MLERQRELSTNQESKKNVERQVGFSPKFKSYIDLLKKASAAERNHICIPFCIDPSPEFTQESFQSFVDQLNGLGVSYTIFLVVNDKNAYESFLKLHAETISKMKVSKEDLDLTILLEKEMTEQDFKGKKIILIDRWREINLYKQESETGYLNYFLKNTAYLKQFKHDIAIYQKKHENVSEEVIWGHYTREGTDFLSWQNKKDSLITYKFYISHGTPEFLKIIKAEAYLANPIFLPSSLSESEKKEKPVFSYFVNQPAKKKTEKTANQLSFSDESQSSQPTLNIAQEEAVKSALTAAATAYTDNVFQMIRNNGGKVNEEIRAAAEGAGVVIGSGFNALFKNSFGLGDEALHFSVINTGKTDSLQQKVASHPGARNFIFNNPPPSLNEKDEKKQPGNGMQFN